MLKIHPKMHDLGVETDVKTNGKRKRRSLRKLLHPLSLRNETVHSNQNDQYKPSVAVLPERQVS